ncbi:HXXEE domain-containing protein [Vacuolonema iberomarrocanum]|uniref:HXXEE domain-containing protein n=1 Tax=Vacuolonema iberomarrocanum TaxID=3454632 RepID=UPI003F6DDAF0
MDVQDLAIWLLAFALIIHTIEEGWLPEYQKVKPNWRSVVFSRSLFLEYLPIFIFSISLAMIGWRWPIIGGILPAVGLTHPPLDHLGLSWKTRNLRPGSWTGLFLLLPLSIWVYVLGNTYNLFKLHEFLISSVSGLAISIWLFWIADQGAQKSH